MAGLRNRAKDFHRCLRNMASFSDGQARVKDWESDDLSSLVVEVTPNDGPYVGGSFCFQIELDDDFPSRPPDVMCTSNIYHPNIDNTANEYNVCLNLFDEWQDGFGLEDCIQGLLFLLHNPNLEDPLSPYFDVAMDEEEFVDNVRKSLIGEEVEGVDFTDRGNDDESEAGGDSSNNNGKNKGNGVDVILEKVEDLLKTVAEGDGDDTNNPGDVIATGMTNSEVTEVTESGKLANGAEVQECDPQNGGEGLAVVKDGESREKEKEVGEGDDKEEEEETKEEREGGEETVEEKSNAPSDALQPMVQHHSDSTLRLSQKQSFPRLYFLPLLLQHMNATTLTRSLTGLDPFVEGGILLAHILCNNYFHTDTRTS